MLKVVGVGFGRTGTLSLAHALETLGQGRCYHFTEMVRAGHVARWLAVARGEAPDWRALFEGYGATTDWPGAFYYRELAAACPDARFILTTRDAQSWYASAATTIRALRTLTPLWTPGLARFVELTDRVIWDGEFDGRFDHPGHAIARFHAHERAVRKALPPERLLVFDIRDGWQPLCAFLDVPVPIDVPFPHVNDRRRLRRYVRLLGLARTLAPVFVVLVTLLLAYAIAS